MADLDEIMSRQGEPAPGTDMETTPPQNTAGQPSVDPLGQSPIDDEDDDRQSAGLHQARDAERNKARRYKEELANNTQQLSELRGMVTSLQQTIHRLASPPQQAQPPAPSTPTDHFDRLATDPEGYVRGMLDPVQQQVREFRLENSRWRAEDKHSPEVVEAAFKALESKMRSDPSAVHDYQRIMNTGHPYGHLVEWHKQQSALSEIGADPQAYRERLRAEILAEMQGGQGAQPPPQTQAQPGAMPTSFAGTRSAGPRTQPQWSGPKPLSELMPR